MRKDVTTKRAPLSRLYDRGLHAVLCRANKSPFWKGWQHLLEAPAHCERPRGENRGLTPN